MTDHKILHVIGAFDKKSGGTYSALYSIMKMENLLGFSNKVLSTESINQEYDHLFFDEKLHLFKKTFPKRYRFSKYAIEWLRDNISSFNLVVIHELWGGLAAKAAIIAKKKGVKYVIWPHGSLDPFDLKKKTIIKHQLGKFITGGIIANAAAICCTSILEKQLLETFNSIPKKVEVLPLPIDYKGKGKSENFRSKYRIDDKTFTLLFLSRIDYKKGLDIFLIALRHYLNSNNNTAIKLVIAGSGPKKYKDFIDKIILDHNLSNYIIHAGFLSAEEKADAFAGADCFVLTSMNENYGISTIEALQSGLPVLISKNIYIWEQIIPLGGWVCEYSVKSIENSIKEIINTDKGTQKNPFQAGEQFTSPSLMKCYSNFYKSLLAKSISL